MKGGGEDVGPGADDLAQLHEEAGEVDAQVVQASRCAVVDAFPDFRRRRPAEALAQQQHAVGDDGGPGDGGDPQDSIGGEAAQHHAALGKRRAIGVTVARGRLGGRASIAVRATIAQQPTTATAPRTRNTRSAIACIAHLLRPLYPRGGAQVHFLRH